MYHRLLTLAFFLLLASCDSLDLEKRTDRVAWAVSMTKDMKLEPYIRKIEGGGVDAAHISILYHILKNTNEVCIHQMRGARGNVVFIAKDGHSEAVFDENENPVEGFNGPSYNYFHPDEQPLYHSSFDISPWIVLGNSRSDETTVEERIYAYMGDLEGGIRRAVPTWKLVAGHWRDDGEIQALAVFLRAIDEGEAEMLFDLFDPVAVLTEESLIDVLSRLNRGLERVYSEERPRSATGGGMEDWYPAWSELVDKEAKEGFASLSEVERVWFCTRIFIDSVENGAIVGFYCNSGADYLKPCLAAFEKLQAQEVVKAVLQVNELFPNGEVPETINARNEVIDTWPDDDRIDDVLDDVDERIQPLLSKLESSLATYLADQEHP